MGLCTPNTREKIKEEILEWLSPESSTRSPESSARERILWITGIPGSGKSTLSATILDKDLCDKRTLVAQFFISRNINETVDAQKVIPTIAKQLSDSSTAAAWNIYNSLTNKDFPNTLGKQVEVLLLAPIQELSKSCTGVIIVIDALDK
ncbi:hypothetical protein B0H13DRAFT_1627938, partial [Mycena leptocephala]